MVRWRGSQPSPLHPTVPLDGSQTVAGLQELQRTARSASIKRLPSAPLTKERPVRKSGRRTLDSLTMEDLTAPPRPWPMFLRGGTGGAWSVAYDVPSDLDALQERLEANALYYLPNYIRVWAGFFTLVIYLRPAAVVGVVVAAGVAYFNLGLSTGSYQLEPESAQLARGLGMIACWIAVAWSRCMTAVLRWLLLSATFTLVHGSLRVGSVAGALQPGVPLAAVLSLDSSRDHRDPRRVFRELWHVADGYSRFAVLTAVDYVSFQYVATRHWLRTRLEKGVRVRPPSQFLY